MIGKRFSFPLYVHITLLTAGLVLGASVLLRWFGDLIPGFLEFALLIAIAALIALVMARRIVAPLAQLAREAEAVRRFDFTDHPIIRSSVREISELGNAFDVMRDALRRFLRINRRLAIETDFETLRPWLLDKLVDIAEAKGGVLYLIDPVREALRASAFDVEGGKAKPAPELPLLYPEAMPSLLAQAHATMMPISGRLQREELQTLGLSPQLGELSVLALPLRDRNDLLLGMLLLFKDAEIDASIIQFMVAVASSAATSLETQELLRSQKELVEATIHMVANAIDAKSPYTSGHCARVPELTFMLAHAACDATEGTFASFSLNKEEWEALQIAGWLHDCGKVITPEYVVDKATKLETIHNRIHEIRTRFEVLKRDAEIAYWRGVAEGGDTHQLHQQCETLKQTLDDEFAFVARCNVGGEFLSAKDQTRLQEIAQRCWLRTLDDRLGLSRDELGRYPQPAPALPVEETLLADKHEHKIARPEFEKLHDRQGWGFKMEVPQLLYHHGELHNLSISRGTLTEEERYKINQHIVLTMEMLGALPLPRYLRSVPEIAGGHHEKMDGTGYPRKLGKTQLRLETRMMAIADIFEALTASDRPYKEGKTLSEALQIMAKMRDTAHIDAELFELFLRSGVYHQYAERYMKPEQLDAVQIERYL